jgi:hypothetical protein
MKINDDVALHFCETLAPIQQYQRLMTRMRAPTVEDESKEVPDIYTAWVKGKNFRKYISAKEKRTSPPSSQLPLQNQANRPLFIRLLAHAIIGLTRSGDEKLLRLLLDHEFTTISSAAAVRISELSGDAALGAISMEVDGAIREGRGSVLAAALRAVEESLYLRL